MDMEICKVLARTIQLIFNQSLSSLYYTVTYNVFCLCTLKHKDKHVIHINVICRHGNIRRNYTPYLDDAIMELN